MTTPLLFDDVDIDRRAAAISDRWPLVFDPESDWGDGILRAVALLDLVAQHRQTPAWRVSVADRVDVIELMIGALHQYAEELQTPTCFECGETLTPTTVDVFGQPTHCPTCNKQRDVRR